MKTALVIGAGAREHAIARRLAGEGWAVTCAPGNAGIARSLPCRPVDATDGAAVVKLAREIGAALVVVGPEAPLVAGVADALCAAGVPAFGPSAAAARVEASKIFAKELMDEARIPTAAWRAFDRPEEALAHARALHGRVVVKADGLAAGKGVTVSTDLASAEEAIVAALVRHDLGEAGRRILLEELLPGRELSLMAVCDRTTYRLLPLAQDYKRAHDGDRGPNTGGMGAVSPPPEAVPYAAEQLAELAIAPMLAALARRGSPFRGVLYAGLMLTSDGPRVLEYNCRLGDPETQLLVERVEGELGEAFLAAATAGLLGITLRERELWAVGVVSAAEGYPQRPRLGDPVSGLDEAEALPGAHLLYAGLAGDPRRPVTAGGRVLNAVGVGASLAEARERAYRASDLVSFRGRQLRRDVGGGGNR